MKPQLFILLLSLLSCVLASYEDARCKCVCVDRQGSYNGTRPTGKVYVRAIAADQCSCKLMLGPDSALCPYCDCKYQVRNTTTIKVVVCLILVIISALTLYMIFLLLLEPLLIARRAAGYKATTTTSDSSPRPGVSTAERAPAWWFSVPRGGSANMWAVDHSPKQQTVAELSVDDSPLLSDIQNPSVMTRQRLPHTAEIPGLPTVSAVGGGHGVATVVKSVRDQQLRWKDNVEAQRARVFSEHTLLN